MAKISEFKKLANMAKQRLKQGDYTDAKRLKNNFYNSYYFKNILSITDIQHLLTPLTEKYFNSSEGMNLQDIYNEVFSFEKDQADRLVKDILEEYKKSFTAFSDAPKEDKEFLHLFSFICMLSFDVYVKKLLIEKLVDDIVPPNTNTKKDKAN